MANVESLRAVIRAQNLGDSLRRSEFQAIVEALVPGEEVRALASGEIYGRGGYLVATDRRVFFAHAGVAGTAVTPVASRLETVQYVEQHDGTVTLIFRSAGDQDVHLDQIPRSHAEVFARALAPRPEEPASPGPTSRDDLEKGKS